MGARDLFRHGALGRDVAQDADAARRHVVGVGEPAGASFHPAELPVAGQIPHRLDRRRRTFVEQRLERLARGDRVVGMQEFHEVAAEAFFEREAGGVAPRRVEEREAALEVLLEEHVGDVLDHLPQTVLAEAQLLLLGAPHRHVADDGGEARRPAVGVARHHDDLRGQTRLAVGAEQQVVALPEPVAERGGNAGLEKRVVIARVQIAQPLAAAVGRNTRHRHRGRVQMEEAAVEIGQRHQLREALGHRGEMALIELARRLRSGGAGAALGHDDRPGDRDFRARDCRPRDPPGKRDCRARDRRR